MYQSPSKFVRFLLSKYRKQAKIQKQVSQTETHIHAHTHTDCTRKYTLLTPYTPTHSNTNAEGGFLDVQKFARKTGPLLEDELQPLQQAGASGKKESESVKVESDQLEKNRRELTQAGLIDQIDGVTHDDEGLEDGEVPDQDEVCMHV